jgi:hypothetical protein
MPVRLMTDEAAPCLMSGRRAGIAAARPRPREGSRRLKPAAGAAEAGKCRMAIAPQYRTAIATLGLKPAKPSVLDNVAGNDPSTLPMAS